MYSSRVETCVPVYKLWVCFWVRIRLPSELLHPYIHRYYRVSRWPLLRSLPDLAWLMKSIIRDKSFHRICLLLCNRICHSAYRRHLHSLPVCHHEQWWNVKFLFLPDEKRQVLPHCLWDLSVFSWIHSWWQFFLQRHCHPLLWCGLLPSDPLFLMVRLGWHCLHGWYLAGW